MRCPYCGQPIELTKLKETAAHFIDNHREKFLGVLGDIDSEITSFKSGDEDE